MKLREYQAKEIFARHGLAVPRGEVVQSPAGAAEVAARLSGPTVIKPQLGVKGRGKVGGIGFAGDAEGARQEAARLLGATIKGERVERLLVEQRLPLTQELYLAVTVDHGARRPLLMASARGGVAIEEVAEREPEALLRLPGSVLRPPTDAELSPVARALGADAAEALRTLHRVFCETDAELVEINPMGRDENGELWALDGVLNVNPDSVARHPELAALRAELPPGDPLAEEAAARHWTYIHLGGEIGIVSSGAGLTMTIVDLIQRGGGSAANFLDTAQIDEQGIYDAFALLQRAEPPKVWLVNIFAGLNRCDHLARGIVRFVEGHELGAPVVVRMVGNQEEEGHRLLRQAGIEPVEELEQAIERCLTLCGAGGAA